jgi:hypothetical protein
MLQNVTQALRLGQILWNDLSKGKLGRDNLRDLGRDGRVILKWFLGKQIEKVWMGLIWLRTETCGGLF